MSFVARWTSTCSDCGDDILPGQEATRSGEGDYRHVICPDETPVKAPAPVCPRCFQELPLTGQCDYCE